LEMSKKMNTSSKPLDVLYLDHQLAGPTRISKPS
jgi:hypothetical protein